MSEPVFYGNNPQSGDGTPLAPEPTAQNQPLIYYSEDPRKPNFPPCRPWVYHNINSDIEQDKRFFVKRAYFSWWCHAGCLFWNWICMFGAVATISGYLEDFFIALAGLLLGFPISFYVYYMIYNAVRKNSAGYFVLWFVLFGIQILVEILWAIGLWGGAGLLVMSSVIDSNTGVGVMCLSITIIWGAMAAYNLFLINSARIEYRNLGGNQAARREISREVVQGAYDNRETIREVIVDNKDVIVDNKDVFVQAAVDSRTQPQSTYGAQYTSISKPGPAGPPPTASWSPASDQTAVSEIFGANYGSNYGSNQRTAKTAV